jgi:hypothetical protein
VQLRTCNATANVQLTRSTAVTSGGVLHQRWPRPVSSVSGVVSPNPVVLQTATSHTLSERRSWSLARSAETIPPCGRFPQEVSAISLFLYITCKSIRELVLVANYIYCVLSAFSVNRLVTNHLFISWRILLALLVKSAGLRLVIIMIVSSTYKTT